MKKLALLIACVMLLSVLSPVAALAGNEQGIRESVARVLALGSTSAYVGSAVAVGKSGEPVQYYITNLHVLTVEYQYLDEDKETTSSTTLMASEVYILLSDINNKLAANVVAVSDKYDLAILETNTKTTDRKPATLVTGLGDDLSALNGQEVWTAGFPAVADLVKDQSELVSTIETCTVAPGSITAVITNGQSQNLGRLIQHSAPMNHGNSGGPLVNAEGQVVGINTYGASDTNYNFSILVDEAIDLLDEYHIPYESVSAQGTDPTPVDNYNIKTIVLISALAVAIIVVLVLLVLNAKNAKKQKPVNGGGAKPSASAQSRTIICDHGALKGKSWQLKQGQKIYIGRHVDEYPMHITIPSTETKVSGKHCMVSFDSDGKISVQDLGSVNGTSLDDKKLSMKSSGHWHRGHKLKLADVIEFSLHSAK